MKRYEVFVSSTYKDLKEERLIVMKALLDKGCFPTGMEEFPSTDQEQFEYIKKVIDTADYYILILGGHVGSFPKGSKRSYTMMEYDYAVSKGIPIILFVKLGDDGEPVICEKSENKQKAYRSFLNEAQTGRIRKGFVSKYELAGFVFQALDEEVRVHPRYGWKRDYEPELMVDKSLLLSGKLFYHHEFGKEIYNVTDQFIYVGKLPECDGNYSIKYGIGTQGAFKLMFFTGDAVGINLYDEVYPDFFDDEDVLREDVRMQISLAKMGNIDEMLMFFSFGNGIDMYTKVFRISDNDVTCIGSVWGQEYMWIDYSLTVPYGSQGLYETYLYCDGEIVHGVDDLDENSPAVG